MITDKDGDEMRTKQDNLAQQESEIKEFLSSLEQRYYELEAEEDTASESSVSGTDRNPTGLEQVMKAQLEDSKRREEKEERAKKEKERVIKERSEAKFRAKAKGLKEEAESISSLATKTPLGTWKDVEDTKVKQSMRELKDWEDKVEKIKQRKTDLIAQMAEAGIDPDDILGWTNTVLAINQAALSVQDVSNELKSEDAEGELHSNATSVMEKLQYPLFEGKEEE